MALLSSRRLFEAYMTLISKYLHPIDNVGVPFDQVPKPAVRYLLEEAFQSFTLFQKLLKIKSADRTTDWSMELL